MTKCPPGAGVGRRHFLCGGASLITGTVAAAALPPAQAAAAADLARVSYPSHRLANVADLKDNQPLAVAYPDRESPCILLRLDRPVEKGAGPDGNIVGFSVLCPHKGYAMTFEASDRTLNCPVHFSRFDCEADGMQVFGHATQNLPRLRLRVDAGGDIWAEGLDELVYGRLSNVLA